MSFPQFYEISDLTNILNYPILFYFQVSIKGWHRRPFTSSSVVVVNGKVKWVLYDDRDKSPTKGEIMEIFLSEDNYFLLLPRWRRRPMLFLLRDLLNLLSGSLIPKTQKSQT